MLAAKTSGEARFCLASETHLATAVAKLNRRLCRLGVNRFVTNLVVALDTSTHEVTIVNAGHPPPIRVRADGRLDEPSKEAAFPPLGIHGGVPYEEVSLRLQPGESLILFTDGVVTATNGSELPFVEQMGRLIGSFNRSPRAIGEAIVAGLRRNLGDSPQEDDICLIVFGRLAAADQAGELE
jgi:serine phosphatase RsbU (regulator of sigma subunit)